MPRKKSVLVPPLDAIGEPTCRHHWMIEPANGPTSWGECQRCHEGKKFQNSIGQPTEWDDQKRSFPSGKSNGDIPLDSEGTGNVTVDPCPENDAGFLPEELDENNR